jgi:hypothetical protein
VSETATITFTFSEDPSSSFAWDGNTGDVVVSGGTLGAVTGSGLTRTATFTPTPGTASGSANITVASGTYTDAAGNNGGAGTTPTITIDALAPKLVITSNFSTLKVGETATITFTFSEDPSSSFAWDGSTGDVVVSGGTLGAISGSGLTRTATFTPSAGTASGSANITVASGTYTDAAGNSGGAGTTRTITIDTLAPTATLTTATLANTANATVQSSEAGTAYLLKSTVSVASLADITTALDANWNSVSIGTANSDTNLALIGLVDGTYNLYTVDAAGNLSSASSNAVTVGAAATTITALSLTSATGIQNSTLNAGDVLTVTATFSEAVTVSGTPQFALNIGGTTVQASYTSGSTTTALTFTYTILASQTDANGISLDADPLSLNSGSILSSAASTPATLSHIAVAHSSGFLVDTTAPAAPGLALATDSGAVDGITNVSTVNLTGLEAGATWQYKVDSGSLTNGTGSSFTLTAGGLHHSYSVHQTDLAGNLGSDSGASNYRLYTTAPTATITDDTSGIASGVVTFTFTFSEAVTGFDASDVTLDHGTKGTFTPLMSAAYTLEVTPPEGPGNMNVGVTTGSFTDVAGNANSVATTQDPQLHATVINLGASGKLIAPANVGGKRYYYWDINGNSVIDDFAVDHNVLDGIFYKSNFVGGAQTPGLDTTDTFHFGTISGWNLSLPTKAELLAIPGATANTVGWCGIALWSAMLNTTNSPADEHWCIYPGSPVFDGFQGDSTADTAPNVLLQVL